MPWLSTSCSDLSQTNWYVQVLRVVLRYLWALHSVSNNPWSWWRYKSSYQWYRNPLCWQLRWTPWWVCGTKVLASLYVRAWSNAMQITSPSSNQFTYYIIRNQATWVSWLIVASQFKKWQYNKSIWKISLGRNPCNARRSGSSGRTSG